MAGKGRGKSWFLVNVGVRICLKQPSKRVLHVSLEMSEMEMRQRYYQRLFSAPKHKLMYRDEETNAFKEGVLLPHLERACSVCHQTEERCNCNPLRRRLEVSKIQPGQDQDRVQLQRAANCAANWKPA